MKWHFEEFIYGSIDGAVTTFPIVAVVGAGLAPGIILILGFANNPANKIDQIVIGSRGMGFPKEVFFRSISNFVLHKAKDPVTIVK